MSIHHTDGQAPTVDVDPADGRRTVVVALDATRNAWSAYARIVIDDRDGTLHPIGVPSPISAADAKVYAAALIVAAEAAEGGR